MGYFCIDCGLNFETHDLINLHVNNNGCHVCDNCGGEIINENE